MINKEMINEFLKPSIPKLVIPLLIGLLIIYSTLVYMRDIPVVINEICHLGEESKNYSSKFKELEEESLRTYSDPDPYKVIELYEKRELLKLEWEKYFVKTAIIPVRFISRNLFLLDYHVYKLDPYYPVPCELYFMFNYYDVIEEPSPHCRFYIDERLYHECWERPMNMYLAEKELVEKSDVKGLMSFKEIPEYPEYRRISLFGLFLHSMIILVEVYLIMCFIFYLPKKIEKLPKSTPYILIAVFMIIVSLWFLYAFFKCDAIMKQVSPVLDREITPMEYKVVYCNNTQVINSSRMQEYIERFDLPKSVLNRSWKRCVESKYEICGYDANLIIHRIGEKPFVICGYKKKD